MKKEIKVLYLFIKNRLEQNYRFFEKSKIVEHENIRDLGSIVLDLFQLSLMGKENFQTKTKISIILLNSKFYKTLSLIIVISETAKSNDYGKRLKSINEKIKAQSKADIKINIDEILKIFANNSGNTNLYSKMLKILDHISLKEEILNQGDSEPIKK